MRSQPASRGQGGFALAVALVILIVITLIGLGAARMSTTQERMTGNFYDRGIAFQNAEAAVRAGADSILTGTVGLRDCQDDTVDVPTACLVNPFLDTGLAAGQIRTVPSATYAKGVNAADQPQYVVEKLGFWEVRETSTGYGQTANAAAYGARGLSMTVPFYRVTGRSGDPAVVGQRASVVLQAIYRQ